jgi:4-amino-4-deoxy-L-arabinose transferase-like glycosyltransferase
MKKNKYIILGIIFILGAFLRFYMLGVNPPSLNWDEASTGYNAYSILLTGKDEYGNFLPLSIRSFDDYKPPLYTYLTIPSIAMFGLTDFAVRLPSAVLGTLTIILIYFLTLEFFRFKEKDSNFSLVKYKEEIALSSAFLFAVSPWSLQFSRAAYEGNIGLFFYLGGLLFFLNSFKRHRQLLTSALLFSIGMYSYHSFRLVIPLTLIILAILFFKELLKNKVIAAISITIFIVLSISVFSNFVLSSQGSGSRLSMVTVFGNSQQLENSIKRLEYDKSTGNIIGQIFDNRRIVYLRLFTEGYLTHFDPNFLFIKGDGGRQHHAVDMGMLYLISIPFILLGLFKLFKNLNKRTLLIFGLFLISPIPSAIASGAPHPVRAIAMSPFFDIFAAVGIVSTLFLFSKMKLGKLVVSLFLILFLFNFTYYLNQYYIHTPREYGDFWQYGYKEALDFAKQNENEFDQIIMTYSYDQPYIYYLYYNNVDPSWYQKNWNFTGNGIMPRFERIIGRYDFKNIEGKDKELKNTLLIGTPDEISEGESSKEIKFLDGTVAFRIIENK